MKLKLITAGFLFVVVLSSCGTDRKDASMADSNRIDTNINSQTDPNPNNGSMADTSGLGSDSITKDTL